MPKAGTYVSSLVLPLEMFFFSFPPTARSAAKKCFMCGQSSQPSFRQHEPYVAASVCVRWCLVPCARVVCECEQVIGAKATLSFGPFCPSLPPALGVLLVALAAVAVANPSDLAGAFYASISAPDTKVLLSLWFFVFSPLFYALHLQGLCGFASKANANDLVEIFYAVSISKNVKSCQVRSTLYSQWIPAIYFDCCPRFLSPMQAKSSQVF
jgi:hypothetical protein